MLSKVTAVVPFRAGHKMAQRESGYTGQYQPRNDMESLQIWRLNGICTPYPPNPDDVLKFVLDLANDAQHFLQKRDHQASVSCSIVALLAADIWPYFRPLSKLRSTFVETIWGASQMVKCKDNGTKKALFYLVDGLYRVLHGEDQSQLVQFLSEICTLIPHAPAGDPDLQRLLCEGLELTDHKITYTEVWVKTIKTLADQSNWKSVAMLLIGYKTGISSSLERMDSSNWSCESITVSAMLKDLSGNEIQDYGESLAIAMLEKGADVDEIGDKNDCPTLHIAVKLAIRLGTTRLLSCILKMYENSPQKRDATDIDGSTALHILVRSGWTSGFRYANEILDILLKSKCDASIVDNAKYRPIDYASSKHIFHRKLFRPSMKSVGELRRDRDQVNTISMVDGFIDCLNGYNYTNEPTYIRYEWLTDACALLIDIPESSFVKCYSQLSIFTTNEQTDWSQVLSRLCKSGEWKSVAYLIFGSALNSPKLQNEITVEILDLPWSGVATKCSTDDVQTNTIMTYLTQCNPVEEAHWLDAVLCSVIHRGNVHTRNNLAVDDNDCALHAATRFCLQTKRTSMLERFVNAEWFFDNGGRNKGGDTVFSFLTKLHPRPDADILQRVTYILLNKGIGIWSRDAEGRYTLACLDEQVPVNVDDYCFSVSELRRDRDLLNVNRIAMIDGFNVCLNGYKYTNKPSYMSYEWLTDACALLINLPESSFVTCYRQLSALEQTDWSQVLSRLCKNGEWKSVAYLIFGSALNSLKLQNEITVETLDLQWSGVAFKCSTDDVQTNTIMTYLTQCNPVEEAHWLDAVLCSVIHRGNIQTRNNLAVDETDCALHAVTRFCIYTKRTSMLERFVNAEWFFDNGGRNKGGDTVFHCLTKLQPRPDADILQRLTYILINKGICIWGRDLEGRFSSGCLDKPFPVNFTNCFFSDPPVIIALQNALRTKSHIGNCAEMIDLCTKVIDNFESCKDDLHGCFDKHEVAVLYHTRAEAYLILQDYDLAVSDATQSINYDELWYKPYMIAANCLQAVDKVEEAVGALSKAYHTVECHSEDRLKIDILSKIATLSCRLPTSNKSIEELPPKQGHIWLKSCYELVRNGDWDSAKIAYVQFSLGGCKSIRLSYPLKPLCDSTKLHENAWALDAIHALLERGCKRKTIKFTKSDEYSHVVIKMSLMSQNLNLLKCVISNYSDWNVADRKYGNGPLHVVCKEENVDIATRSEIIRMLLQCGVKPGSKNHDQKLASHYLPDHEQLNADIILNAVQEGKTNSVKRSKTNKSKPEVKPKEGCEICDELYKIGVKELDRGDLQNGYDRLVCILNQDHNGNEHEDFVKKTALAVVVKLSATTTPEIPDSLTTMGRDAFQMIVDKLGNEDRWYQLDMLVRKCRKNRNKTGKLADDMMHKSNSKTDKDTFLKFASKMTVIPVIKYEGTEDVKVRILQTILSGGARLGEDNGGQALRYAKELGHYLLLVELVKNGADTKHLSMYQGDTPIHAAVTIVLEYTKTNDLVQYLIDQYSIDTSAFTHLDPEQLDVNGNCIFHLIARANYGSHVLKLIQTLCDKGNISAKYHNKKHKLPIDMIKRNDKRWNFLRKAQAVTPATKQSFEDIIEKKEVYIAERVHLENHDNLRVVKKLSEKEKRLERIKRMITLFPKNQHSILDENIHDDNHTRPVSTNGNEIASGTEVPSDTESVPRFPEMRKYEIGSDVEEPGADQFEDTAAYEIEALVFDNLEWEVECTADVWKTLQNKHISLKLKRRIVKKIQMLASGVWHSHLCKKLKHEHASLKLFEAKISKGMRIIWELAIDFSPRCTESIDRRPQGNLGQNHHVVRGRRIYSEIIRVWDIVLKHDNIISSVRRIVKSHQRGTTCIIKKSLRGMKVESDQLTTSGTKKYPVLYAEDDVSESELQQYHQEMQSLYPPASPNETEYHILKFYSFSTTLVSYVLQNIETEVDFPFRVSELEHDIINLTSKAPILLLGRSGTGKTTCCLYRLWSKFKAYWTTAKPTEPLLPRVSEFVHQDVEHACGYNDAENSKGGIDDKDDDCNSLSASPRERYCDTPVPHAGTVTEIYDHLHQLFVTKNVVLSNEVQKNFRELNNADDVMQEHLQQEQKKLPNRLQDVQDNAYPLFVPSRQLLLMLDASIGPPYFFDRKHDGSLKVDVTGWSNLDGPLSFLTFGGDSDVEDDAEQHIDDQFNEIDGPFATAALGTKRKVQTMDPRREITYVVFAEEVWPKIKTKGNEYHPSLVWTEIMSFITGSHEALCEQNGSLDIKKYKGIGEKRAPNFRDSRDSIYEIFQRYETYKRQKNLFDEIDLVHHVFNRLIKIQTPDWVFHQVFVDETQDFTQAELTLLMRLCQNPNEMFLTGDTAQSIMKGISFRFSDLSTLFFHAGDTMRVYGKKSAVEVPKQVHKLTYNYRSHDGILSLANSILELITRFFPDSYDRLHREHGMFPGPQPLLFESCSFADLAVLLRGNRRKTSRIEFGAHQAILVANDTARDHIPEELTSGLILTIYEAKGLEFDDILLYNFFKDSQATKEWRVATSYLDELDDELDESAHTNDSLVVIDRDLLSTENRTRPLTFDDRHHKVLNSELKLLYTALTRARVNVWIFDEDEEKRKPMFEYFKDKKLVKSMKIEDITESNSQESIFAASSDSSDWIKRGKEFMRRRVYNVAAKCFSMGGCVDKEKESLAYHKALTAFNMSSEHHKKKCEELLSAAELLLNCNKPSKAALCLRRAKENKLAANLYERLGQYEEAADIYKEMKLPIERSECYEKLGKFNQGIGELSKSGEYELAIEMLNRYKETSRTKPQQDDGPMKFTEADLYYEGAVFCHRHNDKRRMFKALDGLENKEKKLKFLKEMNYILEAAHLLEDSGKLELAAKLLCMHGFSTEAVDIAHKTANGELIAHVLLAASRKLISESKKKNQPLSNYDIMKAKLKHYLTGDQHTSQYTDTKCQVALSLAEYDQDYESIYRAWTAYETSAVFAKNAGLVECCNLLSELINMERCEMSHIRLMFKGVKSMFHVCQTLLDDPSDIDKLNKYYEFYGLEPSSQDKLVFYPNEYPICIKMLTKIRPKKYKFDIDQNAARDGIVDYLVKRGVNWVDKIKTGLTKMRKKNLAVINGVADVAYGETTVQDIFHALIDIDLFMLKFGKYIHDAVMSLQKKCTGKTSSSVYRLFAKHEEKYKACLHIWNDLVTAAGYPLFLDYGFCRELIRKLRKKYNIVHFERFLADRWNTFISNKQQGINGMEEILFFQFGYYLFGIKHGQVILHSSPIKQIMELKEDLDQAVESSATLIYDDIDAAYSFVEAFHYLVETQQPMKSVLNFCLFQIKLDETNVSSPYTYPDLKHYLMWIEFFTSLSLIMIAKMKSKERSSFDFFLPINYVSLIYFIQATFPQSSNTVEKTVASWNPTSNEHMISVKKRLVNRLEDYAFVISGYTQSKKIIDKILAECFKHKQSIALLERFVVVGLVMICNFGEVGGEVTVSSILSTLINIPPHKGFSANLTHALHSIKRCTVVSDISNVLTELLRGRNNEETLKVCRWHGGEMCESIEIDQLGDYTFSDAISFKKLPATHVNTDPVTIGMIEDDLADEDTKEDVRDKEGREHTLLLKERANQAHAMIGIHGMFEHLRIDDQMCSFCGFNFSEEHARMTDGELAVFNSGNAEGHCVNHQQAPTSTIESQLKDKRLQDIRNDHSRNSRHIQTVQEFNTFIDKYRNTLKPNLDRVKEMLNNSDYQLSDVNVVRKRYGEINIDIERLNNICQEVEKALNQLISMRVWSNLKALDFEQDMTKLMKIFDTVETYVKMLVGKNQAEDKASQRAWTGGTAGRNK